MKQKLASILLALGCLSAIADPPGTNLVLVPLGSHSNSVPFYLGTWTNNPVGWEAFSAINNDFIYTTNLIAGKWSPGTPADGGALTNLTVPGLTNEFVSPTMTFMGVVQPISVHVVSGTLVDSDLTWDAGSEAWIDGNGNGVATDGSDWYLSAGEWTWFVVVPYAGERVDEIGALEWADPFATGWESEGGGLTQTITDVGVGAQKATFTGTVIGEVQPTGDVWVKSGNLVITNGCDIVVPVEGITKTDRLVVGDELGGYVTSWNHFAQIIARSTATPLMICGGSGTIELWADSTPTYASSIGRGVPGYAATSDLLFGSWNGTAPWKERMRIKSSNGYVGISHSNPTNLLQIGTGAWVDSSGNISCLSLTQRSDEREKTNIVEVSGASVLRKLAGVPVYKWNFKPLIESETLTEVGDKTNRVEVVSLVTNRHGEVRSRTNSRPVVSRRTNDVVRWRTNRTEKVTHWGPMSQDWSAQFGGDTNTINQTDVNGVLIAAVRELWDMVKPGKTASVPYRPPGGGTNYLHFQDGLFVGADGVP
jgi:hypothetical protein